jgi:hypothetical protein
MLNIMKQTKNVSSLIAFTLLVGCATTQIGVALDSNTVKIETQRSRIADVRQVVVYKQDKGFLITGKVVRGSNVRGHIDGHVDFELINAKGRTVFKKNSGYQHSGLRFASEKFSVKVDEAIDKGSILRVTHIEKTIHKN